MDVNDGDHQSSADDGSPESEDKVSIIQVSVTYIVRHHRSMLIPTQTPFTSTVIVQGVGMSDSHSHTPSIQEVPSASNTSLKCRAGVISPSRVPVELQVRLDEAIALVNGLVSDLNEVRVQLNALNDVLHTTILDLGNVRKMISKD
jgi:hypothetical protein